MSRALLTSLPVTLFLVSGVVRGAEFSWELAGIASRSHNQLSEADLDILQGTYYLRAVDDSTGPYGLASFLDPTSRISVRLDRFRFEQTGISSYGPFLPVPTPVTSVSQETEKSVGGRYVLPRSKWYAGGSYTTADIDAANFIDGKSYGLLAGKYLGPRTSLEATFDSSETRGQYPYLVCTNVVFVFTCDVAGTVDTKSRSDQTSINLLHVATFRTLRYALSGRVTSTSNRFDYSVPTITVPVRPLPPTIIGGFRAIAPIGYSAPRLHSYSVGGELFPTTRFGIRIGYTRWDNEVAADHGYDAAATWFFTRNVGLRFVYVQQRASPGFSYVAPNLLPGDTATVGVIGRF